MSDLWSEMEKDGGDFLSTFGRDIVFRGKKVRVLLNTNPVDQAMMDGGFVYRAVFQVSFFAPEGSEFALRPPEQGEQMDVYGRAFTITTQTYRPPDPWIACTVQSATQ